jgi:hypothetical protein
MTLDPSTRRKITQVVKQFVEEGKMFTAFEVSLAVKEQGVQQRHRHMKDTVHEVIFEIGGPASYTRTLMDVGAPEQAWVYHLPQDNPYKYVPLPRADGKPQPKADDPFIVPIGVRNPIKLNAAVKSPAAIPPGAFGTDQRGRLCIPVPMLARLGAGPGQSVDVRCDATEEKVYITRPNPTQPQDPDTTYTVEPDGNIRITQGTLEKAGIDHLQCYCIEGNASLISVSKFSWT